MSKGEGISEPGDAKSSVPDFDGRPTIGWPPIDLNDAGPPPPGPQTLPLWVGFAFGLFLASVSTAIVVVDKDGESAIGVGMFVFVGACILFYQERKHHPRWANVFGAGYLLGQVGFIVVCVAASWHKWLYMFGS